MYNWFNIFNKTDFEALGLPSREYTFNLQGIGLKTILATKGEGVSVLVDGVFLKINLNDRNPFKMDSRAVYLDADNNVWVGFLIEN